MREGVVVDTNVLVTANARDTHAAYTCVLACIEELEEVKSSCRLLVDDRNLIVEEYRKRSHLSGQPGAGDLFLKWVWDNLWGGTYVKQVHVDVDEGRGFREFPDDPQLSGFDTDDRKFVAVALASNESPRISNATDTDWQEHKSALEVHGVRIRFLCPERMPIFA